MSSSSEPVIVGFLCNWCAYRAADLIGMAHIGYAPNMHPVRVMCSSRVAPEMVLKAFREGADGVLIAGCHPGECHYEDGNIKTLRRFVLLRRLLAQLGIEEERLQLIWAAASEGGVLAAGINQMTDQLRAIGPLRWNEMIRQPAAVTDPGQAQLECERQA